MPTAQRSTHHAWLAAKLHSYRPHPGPRAVRALARAVAGDASAEGTPLFENPFTMNDLLVFDGATLRLLLAARVHGLTPDDLGRALREAPAAVRQRIMDVLPHDDRARMAADLQSAVSHEDAAAARRRVLDAFFWELTYWKTPDLYDELTQAERLHPGIFGRLAPAIRGRVVLDAGAGSGRATLECLRRGAAQVYALDPSPGLLRMLQGKLTGDSACRVTLLSGRFDAIPLGDGAVDLTLSCSAFTADAEQGGEPGLAELRRVTRPGGQIVVIWPRPVDFRWLAAHGFRYVALPVSPHLHVHYPSLAIALRVVRRFYGRRQAAASYLLQTRRPAVPFSLLGDNPPHDYCWLTVVR